MAAVLGGVNGGDVGDLQEVRQRRGGVRDKPVVAVDEVVGVLLGERLPGGEHVLVHLLHPREEPVEVLREAGLAHTVDA